MTALTEAKKECQQNGAEVEPGGDLDCDNRGPARRPQDESAGDGKHVNEDKMLEIQRVRGHQRDVARRYKAKTDAEKKTQRHSQRDAGRRHGKGKLYRYTACRNRPVCLQRVLAISLGVLSIVEEIRTGGEC